MAIYVIQDARGFIKIGYTGKDAWTRIRRQEHERYKVGVIAIFEWGTQSQERRLHKYLEDHRVENSKEWFRDGLKVRELIERLRSIKASSI